MFSGSWLTTKRLRAHGLMLALCLWSVYLWNMATPGLHDRSGNLKGTDFLHFYTLGSLALAHDGNDLYDMQVQSTLAAQRVPAAAGIQYLPLYPPQVSILFAAFARPNYLLALFLWLATSALIYGLCCFVVWRACPKLHEHKFTVLILAIALPTFWHLIAWGQTSALALACFTAAFFALRSEHEFLAGLALGCLIFKPQLGLAAAFVFLATFRWRVLAGALLSSAAELMAAVGYYGLAPMRAWINVLLHVPQMLPLFEPRLYQTHCLRTFWQMLIPVPSISIVLYIISVILVCVFTVDCWRSRLPLSVRYSTLLFASVLIAPHLTVYDLIILAPAFLLLSDWMMTQRQNLQIASLKTLLYLAFVLPLIGPLARWTHIQFSVTVMAALLIVIWKCEASPTFVASDRRILS
jgi:alpha-1,2-mannosyltransferase